MFSSRSANVHDGQWLRCDEEMVLDNRSHNGNFVKTQNDSSNSPNDKSEESISINLKPHQVKTILKMITRKTKDANTQTDPEYVKPEFKLARSTSFRSDTNKKNYYEEQTQPCRLQLIESKIVSDSEEASEDNENSSDKTKAHVTTVEQSQMDASELNTYHMYESSQPVTTMSATQQTPQRQSVQGDESPYTKINLS